MRAITKTIGVVLLLLVASSIFAQRKITGLIYINGEPAGGILVEANKSNDSYYTSFDGKYELTISEKTKYLRFTFLDESKKLDIEGNKSDVINFSWDGSELPESGGEVGVNLKTLDQLIKSNDSEFKNSYSLYREFFKQKDYDSAMPNWRFIYNSYPKSTAQIYIDGLKMMDNKMDKAMDTHTKTLYLDSMMLIYDKRMKYLDNIGELMGRKAAKYLETVLTLDLNEDKFIESIKKGYGYAEKSIEESKTNTEPAVLVLYMQSTKRLYSINEFSQATVLDNYSKAMDLLEQQSKNEDTKEKADQAISLIEQIIEGSGALNCESMIDLYTPKLKAAPNDIELIKKVLKMFKKEDCENELTVSLAEKLYKLEPSAEAAFSMARLFLKKNQTKKAFEYYKKAYTTATDNESKANYLYETAGLALENEMLPRARDLAKQAIATKSDYCQAYMLLGEIYSQASKTFGDNEFDHSTVFWLAVDYFKKATQYSDCKSDANNKIKFYENYFPNKEEVFFRSLSVGKNHYLGGWIKETTTVRVKTK